MKEDKSISNEWLDIWDDINTIDEAVSLAANRRARPEDIEEARQSLERFAQNAQGFLDKLSERARLQYESQSSSSGS